MLGIRQLNRAVGSRSRYLNGKRRGVDELWRDFFLNTSEWWDHRPDKMNPRYPDFKHKQTGESLWLASPRNPSWVQTELAAIPRDTLQMNPFSWNSKLRRHEEAGRYMKTLEVFHLMQHEGVPSDRWTFLAVLNACAGLGALEEGKHVHTQIIQAGWESHISVGNCLVDMYAKCGSITNARRVFNKLPTRNVVTWSAMIVGYVKCGQGLKAMKLFAQMQQDGVEPNAVTFLGVLNACSSVAALEEGRRVHELIIQRSCQSDERVGNCLVDMYAKCGSIEDARRVFNDMPSRSVVSWNTMIGGYAMHGLAEEAIGLFERMEKECIEINRITFTCLLSACSHGGLVKEGLRYFKSMSAHFNIVPTPDHYASMVDLLGRAGRLREAVDLLETLPLETGVPAWRSLLAACRIHGNIEIAEQAAKRCLELDPENTAAHVLLSNMYATLGKWERSAAIERERLKRETGEDLG